LKEEKAMTIAELRKKDVLKLAERLTPTPTPEEITAAEKTMRAFYRFAAAYQRSFYTEQSRTATQAEKDEADAKSERAYKRAAAALKKYNLYIDIPGLLPIIDEKSGAHWTMGHWYL
jgi:hypothetical protein